MLTKRTQILFDHETYNLLAALSKNENKSIGELVRTAVKKAYRKNKKADKKKEKTLADALKDSFGAWKDSKETDEELMNLLTGPWVGFEEI